MGLKILKVDFSNRVHGAMLLVLAFLTLQNVVGQDWISCKSQEFLVPSDAVDLDIAGRLGFAMDGYTAAMGSRSHGGPGAVWVFTEFTPRAWTETKKLAPDDLADIDEFGSTIVIQSTTMVVGAPRQFCADGTSHSCGAAYVFVESTQGDWSQTQKLFPGDVDTQDFFSTVMVLRDTTLIISTWDHYAGSVGAGSWAGAAYVFVETSPGMYTENAKLVPSDRWGGDYFGRSIAIDGTLMAICSYGDDSVDGVDTNEGSVYVFEEVSVGAWVEVAKFSTTDSGVYGLGEGDADIRGDVIAAGAYRSHGQAGAVYVFHQPTPGLWVEAQKLIAEAEDNCGNCLFGQAVKFSSAYLFVGSSHLPMVYVYEETTPGIFIVVEKIHNSDPEEFPQSIGQKLATSGDKIFINYISQPGDRIGTGIVTYYDGGIDDCVGHLCEHGATCGDGYNAYCCDCPPAYGGELCTDCLCENGGICQDDAITGIGYCDCTGTNARGELCEIPCENGGLDDATTSFTTCDCRGLHFVGTSCQKSCYNGISDDTSSTCDCTGTGASGNFCNKDINDCDSSPCMHEGECNDVGNVWFPNHANEFNCSCDGTGYIGELCETSLCASSPCLHGGTCSLLQTDSGMDVFCNCTEAIGYEGDFCQTDIDECASSPCLNDGLCTDLLGDFACDCTGTGYEGLICSDDVDDCMSSPCQNDGACEDKGVNKFKCTCNEFWEGDACTEDIDDCILKGYYCENGAACADDPVNMGDVTCACLVEEGGFAGKYCNVPIEDACVTFNPCFHGGKCIVDYNTNEMSCDCADTGYEGDVCDVQVYISECVSSPCLNGGQCYDPSSAQDDAYCECTDGYFGDLCDLHACDSMPCYNGGTCTSDSDDYTCVCPENYSGAQCEVDEREQVGVGSSSSSSIQAQANVPDDDKDTTNKDSGAPIIIIVVVVVVVVGAAVGGFFLYKKQKQSAKTYTMPT